MTAATQERIAIVGGGPAGSLLAILLARRGKRAVVIERSPRFGKGQVNNGRSINLALAARGTAALKRAGVDVDVAKLLISMRGRRVHDPDGRQHFLAYGQRAQEEIYSVSRSRLNELLFELASQRHGVTYRFGERCVGLDLDGTPIIESDSGTHRLEADVVFAADGAGSEVRRAMTTSGAITAEEQLLDHGYKELTIRATKSGGFALDPHALHIWPRGGFMLIALPNQDGTFTATLFLPHVGTPSFDTLAADNVNAFFRTQFADALPLFADLGTEYAAHPTGHLGTIHCRPWSFHKVLLIGDAAHAIVPFHGQGMNAAFEDCVVLDDLLDRHRDGDLYDWPSVFAAFESARAPNARAIATMALENYREMRDEVRDPKFQLRAQLSFELERRFPGRFVPRYSMVMFHPEIPYAEAQRRGALQARILRDLTTDTDTLARVDFDRATNLVEELL